MTNIKKKIVIIVVIAALSSPVFALTTGTLNLQGIVTGAVAIVVTPDAAAGTLDLVTADVVDLQVASLNETSNTGYTVTAQSANSSNLQGTLLGLFPYTIKYDTVAIDLTSGSAVNITAGGTPTTAAGVDKIITISYVADAATVADTYTDVITFTITAP